MNCRRIALSTVTAGLIVGMTGIASAGTLYFNSAGSDMGGYDSTTGTLTFPLTQDKGNGRGIVTVDNIVYYTTASSNQVFKRNRDTNADLGVAFSIAGSTGLQAISFDGTNFWVGDYSGTTKAYLVSQTGTLLKTITLNNGGTIEGFYDGLEYFNGKLIANRYDGGFQRAGGNQYDVYDLNGNLLQLAFINTNGHGNGTGIAFDGTDFFISNIALGGGLPEITRWSGTTGLFLGSVDLAGIHASLEDLSFDFAGRTDTCGGPNQPPCTGGATPEPGTLSLLALPLALFAGRAALRRCRPV